jgi:hypothetical protein
MVGVKQQNGCKKRSKPMIMMITNIDIRDSRFFLNPTMPYGLVKTQLKIVRNIQAVGSQKSRWRIGVAG